MNVCIHWPWWSIFKYRYSTPKDETKFLIGIKNGFDLYSDFFSSQSLSREQRGHCLFCWEEKKEKKEGKIIRNGADGVNFQSCVWESSIQILLTNNRVRGADSYSPGSENTRFAFLQFPLLLTCPWRCPGSLLAGWHLYNSTGPNVSLHLGLGSFSGR